MPPDAFMTTQAQAAYHEALRRIKAHRLWFRFLRTSLDLSELGLTRLPPEIGQLTTLTKLDLSNAKSVIEALFDGFDHLGATSRPRNYNQLCALPPEIGRLSALTELDLSKNLLSALPPEIGQLTGLTKLRVCYEVREVRRVG